MVPLNLTISTWFATFFLWTFLKLILLSKERLFLSLATGIALVFFILSLLSLLLSCFRRSCLGSLLTQGLHWALVNEKHCKRIYKWRRCSKKKCCKQCGQVKFMGNMTKWPVQKHTEHHKTRSKQGRNRHKETIFCVFLFFIFNFQLLKGLLQKILNYKLIIN